MPERPSQPRLLPQQPAPVTRRQAMLTARVLSPLKAPLARMLLTLRESTDTALAPQLGPVSGKAYPYGRCRPITNDVTARLQARLQAPSGPVDRALRSFVERGGIIRPIWGALRGQYFQNALQFGGLYVDVANDTVTVTKPKVEILPLAEAGLEAIRGPAHFAEIAARYWGVEVFANHALPALAPVFPMISLAPGGAPRLQSASDYMIDLCRADGFAQVEAWLADGPPPPDRAVEALRARALTLSGFEAGEPGPGPAAASCRAARAAGRHRDGAWRDSRVAEYLALHPAGLAGAAEEPPLQG